MATSATFQTIVLLPSPLLPTSIPPDTAFIVNSQKEELVAAEINPGTPLVPTSQSQITADLLPLGKLPAPSPRGTSDTPVISLQGERHFTTPFTRVLNHTFLVDF